MDFITLSVFSAIGLILLAVIITRIFKYQIEKKALLKEISDATMDFDKIDELKKKGLPLKYFAKLQAAEQLTIEAKMITAESVQELFFLYERAQGLPSKGFRKTVENTLTQVIYVQIKRMEALPAPDQTGEILKEIYGFEKALKNITAPELEQKIYALKKKHMVPIQSVVKKEALERLSETN